MKPFLKKTRKSHFFAVDESSVQLITIIRKAIGRIGQKLQIKTNYKFKGITVIGGIDATGQLVTKIQDHPTTAECFAEFLKQLRSSRPRGKIHIVLDNASFHTRIWIRDLAEKLSIKLHFQPTHSPFVNGAEEIWRQLKQFLKNRFFQTLDDLRVEIYNFFQFHSSLNIDILRYIS